MPKPYMCGDRPPLYMFDGSCDCDYTIEKESTADETVYKLMKEGEQIGESIEIPYPSEYTIESTVSSNQTFYDLMKDGTPVGVPIIVPNINDFVVEIGTEDIWTYRKWDSGTAECWGRRQGVVSIHIQWGGCYYANPYIQTFPTGLFIDVPSVQVFNSSGGSSLVMGGSLMTKDNFNIQHVRGTQATSAGFNNGYYAIGKWK